VFLSQQCRAAIGLKLKFYVTPANSGAILTVLFHKH